MFHELFTATKNMAVLLGVLGYRLLRRTIQGTPRLLFWISDLGFLTTIDDIELCSSDFAICSPVLKSLRANFQSAFRNPHSAIADPVARPPRLSPPEADDGGQARPSSWSRDINSSNIRASIHLANLPVQPD